MHNHKRKNQFTLIELVVAMAVLVILVAVTLKMFTAAIKSSDLASSNVLLYENANLALELMTSDIQSIYFGNSAPLWHWKPDDPAAADWGIFSNELLAFISATSVPQNDNCSSLHEVKYQLFYSTSHNDLDDGWLRRSVTGNRLDDNSSNPNWNFINSSIYIGFDNSFLSNTSITADSSSSSEYRRVIPYVTNVEFTCYDSSNTEIPAHNDTNRDNTGYNGLGHFTGSGLYPYSIQIDLTIMDKNSWDKWVLLDTANNPNTTIFRENNERTFSKMIHIGDRTP